MKISETSTLHLSYYADRIIVSKESLLFGSATYKKKEIMLNNRSTVYNGFMSPATKRKVRTIITTWVNAVEFYNKTNDLACMKSERRLTFATLTLSDSQKHDDNWIKRNMLNRFLIKMQRSYKVKYYFWRAEKQKNGRIHFHIILDHYIDKRDLQTEWNSIQQDCGYLDNFFVVNKRYNAPSTDIRKLSSGKGSIDYLLKYTTKNPEDIEDASLQVQGRIWGCSSELKDLRPYSSGEIHEVGCELQKALDAKQIEVFDHEHFQVYYLDVKTFIQKRLPFLFTKMTKYYEEIYSRLYLFPGNDTDNLDRNNLPDIVKNPVCTQLSLFGQMILDDNQAKARQERLNH